ncbi:hypothetical protein AAG570_013428 [Ranatra chinensis]|uniref:Uncharacterized protein n=1 Tax=Ranatra chinensis TaxID=642074 RepID=A0ABD0Z0D1_9HEMI
MASKRRNMFYHNKMQETTEIADAFCLLTYFVCIKSSLVNNGLKASTKNSIISTEKCDPDETLVTCSIYLYESRAGDLLKKFMRRRLGLPLEEHGAMGKIGGARGDAGWASRLYKRWWDDLEVVHRWRYDLRSNRQTRKRRKDPSKSSLWSLRAWKSMSARRLTKSPRCIPNRSWASQPVYRLYCNRRLHLKVARHFNRLVTLMTLTGSYGLCQYHHVDTSGHFREERVIGDVNTGTFVAYEEGWCAGGDTGYQRPNVTPAQPPVLPMYRLQEQSGSRDWSMVSYSSEVRDRREHSRNRGLDRKERWAGHDTDAYRNSHHCHADNSRSVSSFSVEESYTNPLGRSDNLAIEKCLVPPTCHSFQESDTGCNSSPGNGKPTTPGPRTTKESLIFHGDFSQTHMSNSCTSYPPSDGSCVHAGCCGFRGNGMTPMPASYTGFPTRSSDFQVVHGRDTVRPRGPDRYGYPAYWNEADDVSGYYRDDLESFRMFGDAEESWDSGWLVNATRSIYNKLAHFTLGWMWLKAPQIPPDCIE